MDNDTFVKTTRTGWFARMKNALGGLIVGPIFIIGGVWLLVWNEGRTVQVQEALREGEKEVVSVPSNSVDPSREGKLLYVTGEAQTSEVLKDEMFGISANAFWLRRQSEMYQWSESEETSTQKEVGGSESKTTTYSYTKVWSTTRIDSSNFQRPDGHKNPDSMRVSGEFLVARNARLGAYLLDESILRKLDNEQQIVVPQGQSSPAIPEARPHDGGFYIGKNPADPAIGDIRISFQAVRSPQTISVVGAQIGDGLGVKVARNGYEYVLVGMGTQSAAALFKGALDAEALMTWLIRVGGFVILFIGFAAPMSILGVIGDIVPFIGNIIRMGTGLIAFLLGLTTWTITIALAWFAYRPVQAVILLVIALGIGTFVYRRKAQRVVAAQATA